MTLPAGPIFAGTSVPVKITDGSLEYNLVYYPDKNNDLLQREGQGPHYYYMPRDVRVARDPASGNYMFHLTHFEGVMNEDTSIGVTGTEEVSGGLFSVGITSGLPPGVLQSAHDQLLNNGLVTGGDFFFGRRSQAAPLFGPVPIRENKLSISNISPTQNRTIPGLVMRRSADGRGMRPSIVQVPLSERALNQNPNFAALRGGSNLDLWYANLSGQGTGSINLEAVNAFSGLLGKIPTAILWSSFHGAYSDIVVSEALRIPFWAPAGELRITGSWDRIFEHFSAAAHGGFWWWSADIQVEFNNLMINGDINVELTIDNTLPGADQVRDMLQKTSDLIYQKFMEEAKRVIFDPAPPNVEPAQASGGFLGFGGGFAIKARRDETQLNLNFHERLDTRFFQDDLISSPMRGFYDEIKADPNAERKYFTTLYLDDWERQITVMSKPVYKASRPDREWVGEPVAYAAVQIGYPNVRGDIQWAGHIFQATDGPEVGWPFATSMKNANDVSNPPAGWTPDKFYVKRKIQLLETSGALANPYAQVIVEKNEIDLDPGENGTMTNELNIPVRADAAGMLEVGPIGLDVDLESEKQIVEVSFQALDSRPNAPERPIVKLAWKFSDQAKDRFWMVFTGDTDYRPLYQYKVRVIVKGSIMSHGMEWEGPWVVSAGNGPLMVRVPTHDEAVAVRSIKPGMWATVDTEPLEQTPATTTTTTAPPASLPPATAGGTSAPPATPRGTSTPRPASGATNAPPATPRPSRPVRTVAATDISPPQAPSWIPPGMTEPDAATDYGTVSGYSLGQLPASSRATARGVGGAAGGTSQGSTNRSVESLPLSVASQDPHGSRNK